jgi:hypothetical protein
MGKDLFMVSMVIYIAARSVMALANIATAYWWWKFSRNKSGITRELFLNNAYSKLPNAAAFIGGVIAAVWHAPLLVALFQVPAAVGATWLSLWTWRNRHELRARDYEEMIVIKDRISDRLQMAAQRYGDQSLAADLKPVDADLELLFAKVREAGIWRDNTSLQVASNDSPSRC